MKTKFIYRSILSFALSLIATNINTQTLPLDENLISFNSIEGENLLLESDAREDYFPLSNYFVTQHNLAYCGVASMVMVLNSLDVEAPIAPQYRNFNFFTQDNLFFNPLTDDIIAEQTVARQGMTLQELGGLIGTFPVDVAVYHGADVTLNEFRELIVQNLKERDNFVLVNYLRSTIGQERGGHISPIAAYNEQSDRFLILDVSRYKYPPVWVSAETLWEAINTIDSASNETRGFVLVNKRI